MSDVFKEWLHSALMDLRSIERILDDPFLTPVACFHSQQCVEKSLKAVLERNGRDIPKTHDIVRLFGIVEDLCNLLVDMELLQKINELYIDARYPGDFGLLPDGKPSMEEARLFYSFAKDFYDTIILCLDEIPDS